MLCASLAGPGLSRHCVGRFDLVAHGRGQVVEVLDRDRPLDTECRGNDFAAGEAPRQVSGLGAAVVRDGAGDHGDGGEYPAPFLRTGSAHPSGTATGSGLVEVVDGDEGGTGVLCGVLGCLQRDSHAVQRSAVRTPGGEVQRVEDHQSYVADPD